MSSGKKEEDPHPSSPMASINGTINITVINVAPDTSTLGPMAAASAATAATIFAARKHVSPGPDSYSVEYLTFSRHLIPFY